MLLRLQTLIDEFKKKVIEMEEELHTARLENTLLKNKILELTSSQQQRRGFFGYGIEYK
jgi:regulator of replication initiation timing